jgi:hypothetical protein
MAMLSTTTVLRKSSVFGIKGITGDSNRPYSAESRDWGREIMLPPYLFNCVMLCHCANQDTDRKTVSTLGTSREEM